MKTLPWTRIGSTLVLMGSVVLFPWWVAAVCAVWFSWFFPRYYEVIIAGFLFDALWGTPAGYVGGFAGTVTAVFIIVCFTILKQRIRLR